MPLETSAWLEVHGNPTPLLRELTCKQKRKSTEASIHRDLHLACGLNWVVALHLLVRPIVPTEEARKHRSETDHLCVESLSSRAPRR